jgi:L-Ala-D/L-Glu epimerase
MTPAATLLREATEADVPAIAGVFVAAWRGGYRGLVPDEVIDGLDAAQLGATLTRRLRTPGQHTVVAVDDRDRPVGFAGYGGGYLASLYVHPATARSGVGRRLLRHAVDEMSDVDIQLWVFEGNAAAGRLYEREGFRPDGGRCTDPRWRTPQVRYRRPARNRARPLPPVPDIALPRIRAVHLAAIRRPLRAVFRTALREVDALDALVVRLVTVDGVGLGTTVALPRITGETEESIQAAIRGPLTACLLGSHTLAEALDAIHRAVDGNPCARAGVDLAVHDLAARCAGTDLAGLLGNPPEPVRSDLTVSLDTPQAMAGRVARAISDGFDTVKLKLGDPALDVDRIRAVQAVRARGGPGVRLRLSANQAWTPAQAVAVLDEAHALGIDIELVEQPVAAADLDGMALVRSRSPYPVMADESAFTAADIRRVAEAGAADLINIKLLKCGGLGPARDAIAACADTGSGVLVGCMLEPAEGIAAARALAAAGTAGPLAHDLDAEWWVA